MRRLIADVYKIIFKLTRSKLASLVFAISYVSVMNLFILYGLLILMEEMEPRLIYIHYLFRFPYILGTIALMFGINFRMMLPLHKLSEEIDIKPQLRPLILYSISGALLFAFAWFTHQI